MAGINREALFCAGTREYRRPVEPKTGDEVTLRFRTAAGDVEAVHICFCEIGQEYPMSLAASDSYFDYYEFKLVMGKEPLSYAFDIRKGEEWLHYNRMGISYEMEPCFGFKLIPNFHVPDWAKGVVMYQIFVDRFRDGSADNQVQDYEYVYLGMPVSQVKSWDEPVSTFDVARFYGGDLQGVMEKLDYLQHLNVGCIYFNPLFVSPSNHKYDTQDYDHIDPHYAHLVNDEGELLREGEINNQNAGRYRCRTTDKQNLDASDQLFVELVEACHRRGMRVLVDGVFNHCGSYHKWMNKSGFYEEALGYAPGAYQREDSPYSAYFGFADRSAGAWPGNESYEKWWGNDTLPKLNYEASEALETEILRIAAKWVSPPFNCDGWRLDVAADLGHSEAYNHQFWKKFRQTVKKANPEALIVAEHYGDPYAWLQGDEWDTIMNYDAFMEPVSWFLTGMEKHSDERVDALKGDADAFFGAMNYHMSRMPESSLLSSMNQLSNHDHSRFLTRTNGIVGRLASMGSDAAEQGVSLPLYRLGAMIQLTWPGAPAIYYGDEVGLCGWTDPDSRRSYPWGREDLELLEYHRYLTALRRQYKVLREGAVMKLYSARNIIAYGRLLEHQLAIVIINAGTETKLVELPVWKLGLTDETQIHRVLKTNAERYNAGMTRRYACRGRFFSEAEAYCGKIYVADLYQGFDFPS